MAFFMNKSLFERKLVELEILADLVNCIRGVFWGRFTPILIEGVVYCLHVTFSFVQKQ